MKKLEILERMLDSTAFAIVRADEQRAKEIAQALCEGGLPVMEMSYTLPNAGTVISSLKEEFQDELTIGAGTVLDSGTAMDAILHGAEFIIAPNFDVGVAEMCNRYQIPYAPGCSTLTEAVNALSKGATLIKAFPISDFYGPRLAKVFKTPIPHMPLLASGGINLDNLDEWLSNGIDLCGIGSLLTKGSPAEIKENAKRIREIVDQFNAK